MVLGAGEQFIPSFFGFDFLKNKRCNCILFFRWKRVDLIQSLFQ